MATDAKKEGAADDGDAAKGGDKKGKGAPGVGFGGKIVLGAVILNTVLSGAALALGVKASLGEKPGPKLAQAGVASTEREPGEETPDEDQQDDEAGKEGGGKIPAPSPTDAPVKESDEERVEARSAEHTEDKSPSGGTKGADLGVAKVASADTRDGRGPMVRIENVVVHLRNPELDRFARLTVEYELASQADLGKFEAAMPRLRDGIITTVADRTFEQLAGAAGINALKRDLLEQAGKRGRVRVRAAYLTDFVIQ